MLDVNNASELDHDSGELVLGCDTPESRNKLKDLIASTSENTQMKEVTRKNPQLQLWGLARCIKRRRHSVKLYHRINL